MIFQFFVVLEHWDLILKGFILTMWLYGWAILIGFCLGLILSILRQYGNRILSGIATGYIEIIRGTPLLAQLFLFYFLPFSFGFTTGRWRYEVSFSITPPISILSLPSSPLVKEISIIFLNHRTLIGILTLGLNSAAYQAEYFRGAFNSIGAGQLMAAQSLGMSRLTGIRHVVLPQALRRVIPAWSNEAAYLPKYTVVVYYIGVEELFGQAHNIVALTFISLPTYILIAIIFLVVITIISKGLDTLHKRTAIPGL